MTRKIGILTTFFVWTCVAMPMPAIHAQTPGPDLSVDASADRHPISPLIYGMAYPDLALAKEIRLPLSRWGGDGTTRYNWQIDNTNAGDDWFFMAGGHDNPTPSGGPDALVDDPKILRRPGTDHRPDH